jgi:lipopolysaccharide biosynthesis regulator YciM
MTPEDAELCARLRVAAELAAACVYLAGHEDVAETIARVLVEAAARIEELRKALTDILDLDEEWRPALRPEAIMAIARARAALAAKEKK